MSLISLYIIELCSISLFRVSVMKSPLQVWRQMGHIRSLNGNVTNSTSRVDSLCVVLVPQGTSYEGGRWRSSPLESISWERVADVILALWWCTIVYIPITFNLAVEHDIKKDQNLELNGLNWVLLFMVMFPPPPQSVVPCGTVVATANSLTISFPVPV
jgi:hypothetical protein